MKVSSVVCGLSGVGMASARYAMYADQYHTTTFPNSSMTSSIDHAIMAFMPASDFTSDPHGNFTLFEPLATFKSRFPAGAKAMIAVGGWGDTGFHDALKNDTMIQRFANNVAIMLNQTGLDGVDIDYEYPGGDGSDYKTLPNSELVDEITAFPKFLAAIRSAIGTSKLLSIATPGLERDMIGYTSATVPLIEKEIDFMNIMTYDLMNRRDNFTTHHTGINESLAAVDRYLALGLPPKKANLGIAFYAKYFVIAAKNCTDPVGCPTVPMETADGSDNGMSGAFTFETIAPVPSNLTVATDGACGASVSQSCPSSLPCCSQYGFCGSTAAHCGLSCQSDYGTCNGTSALQSWRVAEPNGIADQVLGGQYYFDNNASLFWTWDTPEFVEKKFTEIIQMRGLGGIMAWSLAEDSDGWELLESMNKGVKVQALSEIAGVNGTTK